MLSRLTTCARSLAPAVSSNFQSVLRPFATSAPSIYDFLIRFHIIDKTGKRHTLQGLSGCSLAQAIFESGKFTDFDDFIFGPDSTEPDTHVYVSNEFRELVRRITQDEVGAIELCADDVRAKFGLALHSFRESHAVCFTHSEVWYGYSHTNLSPLSDTLVRNGVALDIALALCERYKFGLNIRGLLNPDLRSRMASYITLDKTLMDLTVAQGPHQPTVTT